MKQFLIVLCVLGAVIAAYMFSSGTKDAGPKRTNRARPPVQQPRGEAKARPKATTEVAEAARDAAEEFLGGGEDTWKSMLTDETLVRMEDAWHIDTTTIDFDADVLLTMELPTGEQIEITQSDWKRYLCLSLGRALIESNVFAIAGRRTSESFDQPYGFTDAQWKQYLEYAAADKQLPVERYIEQIASSYQLPVETTMAMRRNQVEGMLAYFPTVADASLLPLAVRQSVNIDDERQYLNQLNTNFAEARVDLDAPEAMARLANGMDPLMIIFGKLPAQEFFNRSWSFLDAEVPDNAIMGVFTGELVTDTVMPPWLQPNGGFEYVKTEDVYPYLAPDRLTTADRDTYLRELVWFRVLTATQESRGTAISPEEVWEEYADEYKARVGTAMNFAFVVGGLKGYPSMMHYRAVRRVFEAFIANLPENWQTEEVQREFYRKHRIFVEAWSPHVEIILFTPRRLDGDMSVDWEYARQEGETVREQIISGELDFTAYRNRHHAEMKELFAEKMGQAIADDFDENFGSGELGSSVLLQQKLLKESDFAKMINLASTIRNAVTRLGRGEVSPVWKSPIGYLLIRVHGAGLDGLEGEWEDFEVPTAREYERTMFYKWANEALTSAKQVVAN